MIVKKHSKLFLWRKHIGYFTIVCKALFIGCVFFLFNNAFIFAQNEAPNSISLSACTNELEQLTICHTYTDPDGDTATVVGGFTDLGNSLVILNDTCVRFTPLPGFSGFDNVTLDICDNQIPAACSQSTISVVVGCLAPEAQNDDIIIAPSVVNINGIEFTDLNGFDGLDIDVLANDFDFCDNSLSSLTVISGPANGTTAISSLTSINYEPNDGFNGVDVFTYVSCNNCPACDTAQVTIEVLPPTACATDIFACTAPFTPIELCPLFCDIDNANIEDLTFDAISGTISDIGNGCFLYIPSVGITNDVAVFSACDNLSNCASTIANITIDADCAGFNAPPEVINENLTITTTLGNSISTNIVENIFDADGDNLILTDVGEASNGIVNVNELDGIITYTPSAGFVGTDELTYTVCDENGECVTATLFVEVLSDDTCSNFLEYCTEPFASGFTPLSVCVNFCNLAGTEGVALTDAFTTFNCTITFVNDTCIELVPLPGFLGEDLVTIIGCNAANICDTIYATINVGCFAPEAANDSAETASNQPIIINALANDQEICGYDLEPIIFNPPVNGTATFNEDDEIIYTPNPGFVGIETFSYAVCSSCDESFCDIATVTVQVNDTDSTTATIVANDDIVFTPFNTPLTFDILGNDIYENPIINIIINAGNGTVVVNDNNTVTFAPNVGYSGTDYFTYQLCNEEGDCDTALVAVTVWQEGQDNLPPVAQDDAMFTPVGESVEVLVLDNDIDPQGSPLTVIIGTPPSIGSAVVSTNNTIIYTPEPGYTGVVSFTYNVCNDFGLCSTATIDIYVGIGFGNTPPIALDDEVETSINTAVDFNILENDSDAEDDNTALTSSIITTPNNGTVTLSEDGTATYSPNTDFVGNDFFTYLLCDSDSPPLCDTASVSINVSDVTGNLPPIAANDFAFGVTNGMVTILAQANDQDPDNDLSELIITAIVTPPSNGTAEISGTQIIYIPNPEFEGMDTLVYSICDPSGLCDEAFVYIVITPDVVAIADFITIASNTPVTFNPLINDLGIDVSLITFESPQFGTLVANADGTLTYTSIEGYGGADFFEYQICDDYGNCDVGVVNINVIGGSNAAPIANNDMVNTPVNTPVDIDALGNDIDPEGQMLTISNATQGSNGTVIIVSGNQINYVPDTDFEGTDEFIYVMCDPSGLCDTATVMVIVGENGNPNNPPTATDDFSVTTVNEAVVINILFNDTDEDGHNISITNVGLPTFGTVVINSDSSITYTPAIDFVGEDVFAYTICDNGTPELCSTAIVEVVVLAAGNNANILVETAEETSIEICIDDFLDLAFTIDSIVFWIPSTNGSPFLTENASCIGYVPAIDFTGLDNMVIGACTESGLCDSIFISIDVLPINDPPTAVNDSVTTPINQEVLIDIMSNDSDPDGDEFIVQNVETPGNGTISPGAGGVIYTPNPDFTGIDSFTYTIVDADGLTDDAWVFIAVGDVTTTDSVLAVNDIFILLNNINSVNIEVLANDFATTMEAATVSIIENPLFGEATVNTDNSIEYTPSELFTNSDTLTYVLCINNQCDTAQVFIQFETTVSSECTPIVAQGFSPNNDNTNDVFLIQNINESCYQSGISLNIFNRWGDVVYAIDDYSNDLAWRGTFQNNAQSVPSGTYFYILEYVLASTGELQRKTGFIELLR